MPSGLPPGPSLPAPLQTLAWVTRPKPFLRRAQAEHGDQFTIRIFQRDAMVVLADPEHVKQVFTGPADVLRAGEANEVLMPVLGPHSVLLLDGAEHLRQRRLMLPAFHGERMRLYRDAMVEATQREVATWPIGEPVALAPRFQAITLEVILRTVFGIDDAAQVERLRTLLLRMLEWTVEPWKLFVFAQMPVPVVERWLKPVLDPVDRELLSEVAAHRRTDLASRDDVLSMLLQAEDEDGRRLGDDELRDELVTLLVAGHETTATALSWAVERLRRHPEVLARAVEDAKSGDGSYLDAVCKETLRLRPVIPLVVRRLKEPMTIGDWELPEGTDVAPGIFLVHERPDVYPDPHAFRPERFLDTKPGTYTWLPFGGGIRRCLGASFALFEMQAVLGEVLRSVELLPATDGGEPTGRRAIVLTPSRGAEALLSRAA
jgi:cytochrome P450 family 135